MYVCMYACMHASTFLYMNTITITIHSNLICFRLQKLYDLSMISPTSQIKCSLTVLTQTHRHNSNYHGIVHYNYPTTQNVKIWSLHEWLRYRSFQYGVRFLFKKNFYDAKVAVFSSVMQRRPTILYERGILIFRLLLTYLLTYVCMYVCMFVCISVSK